MATLHIRDETYRRLAQKAAALQTTIEDYVEPLLDRLAEGGQPRAEQDIAPSLAQRRRAFDEWMVLVQEPAAVVTAATLPGAASP